MKSNYLDKSKKVVQVEGEKEIQMQETFNKNKVRSKFITKLST